MRLLLWLILPALAQAAVSVTCIKTWDFRIDTSTYAHIAFTFTSLAPLGVGRGVVAFTALSQPTEVWGERFLNASEVAVASRATSSLWDRDLKYAIKLSYFRPGLWSVAQYLCRARFDNGAEVEGVYYKVEEEPPRQLEEVAFVVPRSSSSYRETREIRLSLRPDRLFSWMTPLCVDLPDASSWPSCRTYYTGDNLVLRVSTPGVWRALEIAGKRPGDVVEIGGVYARIPDPWLYGDCDMLGCRSTLATDAGVAPAGAAQNIPFSYKVELAAVAAPLAWGKIELRPPREVPLYVSRVVQMRGLSCQPPDCFTVATAGNATWAGRSWAWNWTLASVAVKSPYLLTPYVAVRWQHEANSSALSRALSVYAPLGSAATFDAAVVWRLDAGGRAVWIDSTPGTYLRAVDDAGKLVDYEKAGALGKLSYRAVPASTQPGIKWASFNAAVDPALREIKTAWFSPPNPCRQWPEEILSCVYSQHVYSKVNGTWVGYSRVGTSAKWPIARLPLVDWLIPQQGVCGRDGYRDFMELTAGDPVLYFWHVYRLRAYAFNPNTGDWDIPEVCVRPPPHHVSMLSAVYGASAYRNTTRGFERLYFQTAEGGAFYNYLFEGVAGNEYPAGWTDALPLGLPSMVSNSTGPWLVYLAPTTLCDAPICTAVDARIWGPAPGPIPDVALPNAGYTFLVIYTGSEINATLRLYVEMGKVAEPGGLRYRDVGGTPLAEVRKTWRPLDGVYVGPGWWIGYTPLGACHSIHIGQRPVYITPANWTGPIAVTLEVEAEGSSKRYSYVFFVTRDVSYKIEASSAAPQTLTSLHLNTTIYLTAGGVPYFHGYYAVGEGGRLGRSLCVVAASESRWGVEYSSQLAASGDFWGEVHLLGGLRMVDRYVEPKVELVDPSRSLVKISVDAPAVGFAFYLMRGGAWTKAGEWRGRCVVVNATATYPWDPVLILPIVREEAQARPGDVVELWRPKPILLYKTWADPSGFPRGRPSSLSAVKRC
ncbi:hypothetical protein [Pyrobaculum neutrophilum]|uniref:Uncharacterized protein n=1 Tax=Pyrobaculum neutrophilum (strain DSM 2338 / JCM 9278 / NBRC 100436 / V24Sta) TaxID=444157 RepID=B1Y8R1_PYRNV|nr:hypothetical protein [Pyrobaculum neutrophilum]ACB40140.1 conserved hypothetical protein [Pyrobaculum neutrophilum V24Sta]